MAKALNDWIISAQENLRPRFSLYCGAVIDKNAELMQDPKTMKALGGSIAGEVFDIQTKENEGYKSILIENIGVKDIGNGTVIYYAEAADGEVYYFDIWTASYEMKQAIFKSWLKTVPNDGVRLYLSQD